jgi:hypothetical protein
MKRKPTFKSLLVAFSILSLFAFVFVNATAAYGNKSASKNTELISTQIEDSEKEAAEIPVPDVTLLGKLWEIAQKLMDRKG